MRCNWLLKIYDLMLPVATPVNVTSKLYSSPQPVIPAAALAASARLPLPSSSPGLCPTPVQGHWPRSGQTQQPSNCKGFARSVQACATVTDAGTQCRRTWRTLRTMAAAAGSGSVARVGGLPQAPAVPTCLRCGDSATGDGGAPWLDSQNPAHLSGGQPQPGADRPICGL